MKYRITTYNGAMTLHYSCETVVDVLDNLSGTYGTRYDDAALVLDLLSGLEHTTRIDDVWVIVTPWPH